MNPIAQTSVSGDEDRLAALVTELKSAATDQFEAAWQIHVDRVTEELAKGWREHILTVVEERFTDFSERARYTFAEELECRLAAEREAAAEKGAADGARRLSERLNLAMRRLTQPADRLDWAGALLEAALPFCQSAALFRPANGLLRLEGTAGFDSPPEGAAIEVPPASAPAIESAIGAGESVIAPGSANEISEVIAAKFPPPAGGEAVCLPLRTRDETSAVLYAAGRSGELDLNGLKLVAALGSVTSGALDRIPAAAVPASSRSRKADFLLPPWLQLSREEQDLHMRAQRFARVQAAELRLYKSMAVKEGRARSDLYARLKDEIDGRREAFREQFMGGCPSMVDYFHLEVVRTLANEDDALLGPGYPGPLV